MLVLSLCFIGFVVMLVRRTELLAAHALGASSLLLAMLGLWNLTYTLCLLGLQHIWGKFQRNSA